MKIRFSATLEVYSISDVVSKPASSLVMAATFGKSEYPPTWNLYWNLILKALAPLPPVFLTLAAIVTFFPKIKLLSVLVCPVGFGNPTGIRSGSGAESTCTPTEQPRVTPAVSVALSLYSYRPVERLPDSAIPFGTFPTTRLLLSTLEFRTNL